MLIEKPFSSNLKKSLGQILIFKYFVFSSYKSDGSQLEEESWEWF